jgi:hypothetical protein
MIAGALTACPTSDEEIGLFHSAKAWKIGIREKQPVIGIRVHSATLDQ